MKRPFLTLGSSAGIAIVFYVGWYFLSVREGTPRTAVGISWMPAYETPLSERNAERVFSPIHALDRRLLRRSKWGDELEERMFAVHVPREAAARTCKFHHAWRTNATVPVLYGTPDPAHPYFSAQRLYFPNSWSHLDGGCVFETYNGRSSATQAVVKVCGRCREAEKKWEKTRQANNDDTDQSASP